MAKRRILKKEIGYLFGSLFSDMLICRYLFPETKQDEFESLATRICQQNDEFIRRAHHAPSKRNKVEVKKYYRKLYADLDAELNALASEIDRLTDISDKAR